MSKRLSALRATLKAVTFGVITAVILVVLYTLMEALVAGCASRNCMVPIDAAMKIAAMLSLYYALLSCAIAAPIWVVLCRLGAATWLAAVALGFGVPLLLWFLSNNGPLFTTWETLRSGLPYAICGALAGWTTWRTSSRASSGTG